MSDLLERLRCVDGEKDGTRWYRNPDGPEAANEIERLRDALRYVHDHSNDPHVFAVAANALEEGDA